MNPSFSEQKSPARFSRRILGAACAGLAASALLLASGNASAQTAASDAVAPTGKGIVGGALLGGEVVDLTMGIIGVNRGWPYLVFGGLGAVGGGIGGYFIEQNTKDIPEVDVFMLAGGMALVIPTIVVSLKAVGIILVIAMLVTPGCVAYLLSDRFGTMLVIATVTAVGSALTGVYVSFFLNASTGACIVLVQALVFLVVLGFAPKHGLLKWRRGEAVP